MAKTNVSAKRLREVLHYEESTGIFTWKAREANSFSSKRASSIWKARYENRPAGSLNKIGYITIRIDGILTFAHRAAWAYVHGHWPPICIDHINACKSDNRISNLRLAGPSMNSMNRRIVRHDSSTGFMGVRASRSGRSYYAYVCLNHRQHHIGAFKTAEEAHAAYLVAKDRLHPGWR